MAQAMGDTIPHSTVGSNPLMESPVSPSMDEQPRPKNLFEAATTDTAKTQGATGGDDVDDDGSTGSVDLDRMRDTVFFLYPNMKQRLTKFWLLLILAAIIATSGVVGDSAATVIGAMIVAPLMTPILGTMLAIVLTDQKNFWFSLFLVLSGVSSCFLIGLIYGYGVGDGSIAPENNSQVAARTEPKLPDLIGAIATGAVGSIALVRRDVADALPGVAISISLVPPICVAGMMVSIQRYDEFTGAALLFATNIMSILVVGIITMYVYKVPLLARRERARSRKIIFIILFCGLCLLAFPLGFTSYRISQQNIAQECVREKVLEWTDPYSWQINVAKARYEGNDIIVSVVITGKSYKQTNKQTKV